MPFAAGTYPFGKIVKFGGMDFNGPGSPISVNIDWQSAPISLIDGAYPTDPFTDRPATNAIQKAAFTYGLLVKRSTGSLDTTITNFEIPKYPPYRSDEVAPPTFYTPLQGVEFQWNTIYLWMRQHNNQSSHLIVDSANSTHDYAYARARIEKLELAMTPGKDTNAYVTTLNFTLLSPWAETDPLANIINTDVTNNIVGDVHVPFGNLISFNGFSFVNTNITNPDGSNPLIGSTVVQNYLVEWATKYRIVPHKAFPIDSFGVSPCPLKPITAEWELSYKADTPGAGYYHVNQQYNSFLVAMMNGNQKGKLVCQDAWGNAGTCIARLKSYPLTLTPQARTHYFAKLTFDILSDWRYTVTEVNPLVSTQPIYQSIGNTVD